MDRSIATPQVPEETEATPDTTLHGRWLTVARVAWVTIAVLAVGIFAAAVPYDFQELQRVCVADDCKVDVQLRPADARALEDLGLSIDFYAWVFDWPENPELSIPEERSGSA